MRSSQQRSPSSRELRERYLVLSRERDKRQAERSLYEFVRQAWPTLLPSTPFVDGWHIEAICIHLEAVARGDIRRLVINIPPRHLKSTLVSICWPAWMWATQPHLRFLCASYAEKLSLEHAVGCRRLIESEWYQRHWGHVYRLTGDQNAKEQYDTDKRGYRISTSVGGRGTGSGGDILVIDDPHNMNEIHSDAAREGVLSWWRQAMSTRFNDPRTGRAVLVMQRGHEEDLSGYFLSQGGWTHLRLPARFEADEPCETPIGWRDPRTSDGELLHPERVPEPELEEMEKDLGAQAPGQLQQRPTAAGGEIFREACWKRYSPHELPERFDLVVSSWDLSFDGKATSDWNVGAVWGLVGARKYLLDLVRRRMGFSDQLATFASLHERNPLAHTKLVEAKANGAALIDTMKSKIEGIVPREPQGNKVQRAWAVEPTVSAGDCYIPRDEDRPWAREWVAEHSAFPKGKNDDQVDTTTQVLLYFREVGAGFAGWQVEPTAATYRADSAYAPQRRFGGLFRR